MFYARVKSQDARPKLADSLKRQNDELKQKLATMREERDQLAVDVKQLARIVHVLEVENYQLRKAAGSDGVVRVFPSPRR